jgi:hypothetical protein
MAFRQAFTAAMQSTPMRIGQMVLGVILLIITPIIGTLPGPGGVFVFAIGLGLVLRNSRWAKKRYVDFKRRYPKSGGWADWGLRRPSAKRRQKRAKDGTKLPKGD